MQYVNLGCGNRYHPAWTNIDIVPRGPGVIRHDLARGIPLPDASCDVVYHAAVLEHLRRADALAFLRECVRVLKPGGIIRVGVPDLERLCQLYLIKLQAGLKGDATAADDYDWIILELYDQTVRERGGGEMLTYLRQDPLPNQDFVYERIGEEGRQLVQALRQPGSPGQSDGTAAGSFVRKLSRRLSAMPAATRRHLLRRLLGADDMRALEIGRFRLAGEVHQWMYDRYSLARLLQEAGFYNPIVQEAMSSRIPDWSAFHLDTLSDGSVIKPDLLFMEATTIEVGARG
jgi:SAM-dependent methyltransferase